MLRATRFAFNAGLTLETGWTLTPPILPADFVKLVQGQDSNWAKTPASSSSHANSFAHVHANLDFYAPRAGQVRRGVKDSWVRFASGELFTNNSLGFIADAYPYVVEAWRPGPDDAPTPFGHDGLLSYPTLALNLEAKKDLARGT